MDEVYTVVAGTILHVLLTVLVVDRLLTYRENKKWDRVHRLVRARLQVVCGDVLHCWADWLESIDARAVLLNHDRPSAATDEQVLPLSEVQKICRAASDDVQLADTGNYLIDFVVSSKIEELVLHHLLLRELPPTDPAWKQLNTDLSQALDRISEILPRLPPENLDFFEAVEQMYMLLHRINPQRIPVEAWSGAQVPEARAAEIAHSIGLVVEMRKLVRLMPGARDA